MSPEAPGVSVVVPLLNEAGFVERVIAAVLAQEYDGELEFIFVDNGSTDGTRERLAVFAAEDPRVKLVDNPVRGIPGTLNKGLAAASKEFFARMDAHTEYPPGYIAAGVEAVTSGRADWAAGAAHARGDGAWSRWVAAALSSKLGVGGADFRSSREEIYTDTAFGGVARRELFERLGGWDVRWVVNEDAELATRARAAGHRLLLVPAMAAFYIPRDSIDGLAKQYWRYGLWRARTSVEHPASMRPSHVLPPLVVLALAAALLPLRLALPARLAALAYGAAVAKESARLSKGDTSGFARLVAIFPAMHISWGAGNIAGFARFGSPLPALRSVLAALAARLRGQVSSRGRT